MILSFRFVLLRHVQLFLLSLCELGLAVGLVGGVSQDAAEMGQREEAASTVEGERSSSAGALNEERRDDVTGNDKERQRHIRQSKYRINRRLLRMDKVAWADGDLEADDEDQDHDEDHHVEAVFVEDDYAYVGYQDDSLAKNEAFPLAKLLKDYRAKECDQEVEAGDHLHRHVYRKVKTTSLLHVEEYEGLKRHDRNDACHNVLEGQCLGVPGGASVFR